MTKLRINHLRLVDDQYAASRRAYAIFIDPDDEEYELGLVKLESAGRVIINGDEERPVDDVDMRLHLQCLAIADDLVLPDTWWTSTAAHKLVTVAGWMGVKFISVEGVEIPTVSAGGRA